MTPSVRVSRYLEEELQRVEDRLRAMRMEPTSLHSSTSPETDENSGDSHDPEWASLTTEIVDETHSRLLTRRANLREALRRLQNGSYGRCGACGRAISERRLLVMPEATLCRRCQERRERRLGLE